MNIRDLIDLFMKPRGFQVDLSGDTFYDWVKVKLEGDCLAGSPELTVEFDIVNSCKLHVRVYDDEGFDNGEITINLAQTDSIDKLDQWLDDKVGSYCESTDNL